MVLMLTFSTTLGSEILLCTLNCSLVWYLLFRFGAAIVSESGPSFVFPLGFESIFHIPFCSIRNYDDAFVPFSDINPNQVCFLCRIFYL